MSNIFSDFFKELFEAPAELYDRLDSKIVERFRPTTQRLDKIHPKLKYFASGNEVFSQAAIALPLYSFTKSTVYSDFMFIQNPFCLDQPLKD